MSSAITIDNLNFSYERVPVLEDVNLGIDDRDFGAIIGPNGGGKTTLIKLILGLLEPSSGNISVFGRAPGQSAASAGYVPQFFEADRNFPISVLDVVISGLMGPSSLLPWNRGRDIEAARKTLSYVGIQGMENKVFGTLSGGQRQRVLIARAIVSNPRLLILDEPTTSIDNSNERDIYELFRKLNEKMTIILVTHDLGFVSACINKVVCVNKKVSVHDPASVDQDVIAETYHSPMSMIVHKCGL